MSAKHTPGPCSARFSYVAWNMAAHVMPVKITIDPNGGPTHIVYECGHSGLHANHFMHTLDDRQGYRCGDCGKAAASKLPEFAGWYDERGAAAEPSRRICPTCSLPPIGDCAFANCGRRFAAIAKATGSAR